MSATVELSVILRDGTKTSFTQPAGNGDPCVDIKILQKSLSSLQHESNAFLTKLVEQEKSVQNGNQSNQNVNRTDDDEEDESEESDAEDKDKEPAKKKQKT